MQLTSEKVTNGGETADRFGRTRLPLALEVLLRLLSAHLWDADQANLRILGRTDFQVGVLGRGHGHCHVRLPRTDPDFADQHISELDAVLAFDRQLVWAAGGQWLQLDHPFAVFVGHGSLDLLADCDRDFLAIAGPAPDSILLALLQYHMLGEN